MYQICVCFLYIEEYSIMGGCLSEKQKPKNIARLPVDATEKRSSAKNIKKLKLLPKISRIRLQGQVDSEYLDAASKFIDQSELIVNISNILKDLCYTEEDHIKIAEDIADLIIKIQNVETIYQKNAIRKLLQDKTDEIEKGQIHYEQLKKIWEKQNKTNKQAHFSRIFHSLVNSVKVKSKLNGFSYVYTEQLEELVELQHAQYYTEEFGDKFYFMLHQIKQQSGDIHQLLANCFSKYSKQLSNFKYNLDEEESLEAAKISRDACDYHQKGIFLLLIYFVKSCQNLEKQGKDISKIEEKMNKMLKLISQKYPPGQGLKGQSEKMAVLGKIQRKQDFDIQSIRIKDGNKREQLSDIIMKNAKIAEKNREDFEHLIRNTCLKHSMAYKTGLKFNPDYPNPKAQMRIQQKMFLKNKSAERSQKNTINGILEDEQQIYKKTMEKQLQLVDEIKFSVSDMVRGKCVFSSLQDIIETLYDIIKFVDCENAKSPGKYRITELESRFTKKIPISDVTLKIALNEQIVAELQLTLQNNLAAYNFAHKIYEFNRSKLFSKIKIIHNYYQEYQREFDELVKRSLYLAKNKKQSQISNNSDVITKYFEIEDQYQEKSFKKLLGEAMSRRKDELVASPVNPSFQPLMNVVFDRKMKKQQKLLAQQINQWIQKNKKQCSRIFKGKMLFQFIKDSDMAEDFHLIKQDTYEKFLKKEYQVNFWREYEQQLKSQVKVYLKFTALTQLFRIGSKGKDDENQCKNIIQATFGEFSIQNIKLLITQGKLREFYEQKHSEKTEDKCSKYFFGEALKTVQNSKLKNKQSLASMVQLLMAQNLLKNKKPIQAKKILENNKILFKQRQQYNNIILCQLLLAQCTLYEQNLEQFKRNYDTVLKIVKMSGLALKGVYIAEASWRIGVQLWKMAQQSENEADKKQAFQVHFNLAISEFGSYLDPSQLFERMKVIWPEYKKLGLDEPKLKPNLAIKQLDFFSKKIGDQHCMYLSKVQWPNLTRVYLGQNKIGKNGYEYLSQTIWPNLKKINLQKNNIGKEQCKYLCKAQWPNLTDLNLFNNNLGNQGCEPLSKAQWPSLMALDLGNNNISKEGCQFLSKANWKNFSSLDLGNNSIGKQGCEYLSQAQWPNMTALDLGNNSTGKDGCRYLMKAQWPNLTSLILRNNNIDNEVCELLSKVPLYHLSTLVLSYNNIDKEGCEHLRNAKWANLTTLDLKKNNISDKQNTLSLFQSSFSKATITL